MRAYGRCGADHAAAHVPETPGRVTYAQCLPGGRVECFGMGPAIMLGEDLADSAGPVGDRAVADLAARDRQLGDRHGEAART
jgi:hypothetical protein